ncbi:MAG: glycoside hydrolase family 3 protein [Candidatus Fimenecus sp.]
MSVVTKIVENAINLFQKNSLAQETAARAAADKTVTDGMPEILRRAAAEGAVLLKNTNYALPLSVGTRISLFGRGQIQWFYTGYGSGGDVNKPYAVSLLEGLRACPTLKVNEKLAQAYEKWDDENPIDHGFWGHWPRFYPDMPLSENVVREAAQQSDCAVVTIGRSSGEDRENALEKGSFYLTDAEQQMLSFVTAHFEKTVVLLNVGSVMDLSWVDEFDGKIDAVLLLWQGGMESGNAAADLLSGKVTPCGKLTDTVAKQYANYPSAADFGGKDYNFYTEDIFVGYRWFETFAQNEVLYPFGYGLSYTDFSVECAACEETADGFSFTCTVQNIGEKYSGKEVVAVYLEKPCGALGNPARELAGFAKTDLLAPNASETVTVTVPRRALSSYDDSGVTGHKSAYVTEKGEYAFFLGGDVRAAKQIYTYSQPETVVTEQLTEAAAPQEAFSVIQAMEKNGVRVPKKATVSTATRDLRARILENLPKAYPQTGDRGYKLADVRNGTVKMADFVAQLDLEELEAISRGAYRMNSPLGTPGNAGVFGGVLDSLRQKGVPPVTTTDGPSGIRLYASCSLLPIGTLLACTFDTALVEVVYRATGAEMREKGTDVLLGPGINIHRNPLCGRNFEYYSEDPLLTGKIAAAAVRGLQSNGVSACPKHFACNNQEYRRNRNDSRLSERALREIYLKGFEICVKEAAPQNIMTSYNRINGVYGHYHYDLCTTILRGEWDYTGCVMTDWWLRHEKSHEFPKLKDQAYRVRAQVDVLMPGGERSGKERVDGTLLKTYGKPDGITLGELQRTAENVLRFCLHSPAMERMK